MLLPGNHPLPLPQAIAHLHDYPQAIVHLYDGLHPGPHDPIQPCDVTSLAALNVYVGGGATAMAHLWSARQHIEALVQQVPHTPLQLLAPAGRATVVAQLNAVLMHMGGIPGWGGTGVLATKLLHRLRPNVAPIWDRFAGEEWFDQHTNDADWVPWLTAVHDEILREENRSELEHMSTVVCPALFGVELSIVRVWDIILWSEGQP